MSASCYKCKNHPLCFLRREMDAVITTGAKTDMIDVDKRCPNPNYYAWQDILFTLASLCKEYDIEEEV